MVLDLPRTKVKPMSDTMSPIPEKDVERARQIDHVTNSDESLSKGDGELRTLDTLGLDAEGVIIELTEAEKKQVMRKVDWRVVTCCWG
jgi:hypothetical protein